MKKVLFTLAFTLFVFLGASFSCHAESYYLGTMEADVARSSGSQTGHIKLNIYSDLDPADVVFYVETVDNGQGSTYKYYRSYHYDSVSDSFSSWNHLNYESFLSGDIVSNSAVGGAFKNYFGPYATAQTDKGYTLSGDWIYKLNLPLFDSQDSAKAFFLNNDLSGLLNGIGVSGVNDPSLVDHSYHFLGFSGNNSVTALWSGTSQRSFMLDSTVQESVTIIAGYAYNNSPGQIADTKVIDNSYPVSNLSWSKLYSDLTHESDSVFLRYIRFVPYYYRDMFSVRFGEASYLWFDKNGNVSTSTQAFVPDNYYLQNVRWYQTTDYDGSPSTVFRVKWDNSQKFHSAFIEADLEFSKLSNNPLSGSEPFKREHYFVKDDNVLYSLGSFSFDIYQTLDKYGLNGCTITGVYLRLAYQDSSGNWKYSGFTKAVYNTDGSSHSYNASTGYFDDSGNWVPDLDSDYSYSDDYNDDPPSILDNWFNNDFPSGGGSSGVITDFSDLSSILSGLSSTLTVMINSVGQFPRLLSTVFSFLPSQIHSSVYLLCLISLVIGFAKVFH